MVIAPPDLTPPAGLTSAGVVLLFPVPAVRTFYGLALPRGELGPVLLVAAAGSAALVIAAIAVRK